MDFQFGLVQFCCSFSQVFVENNLFKKNILSGNFRNYPFVNYEGKFPETI
jgi:hypothetical protein